MANYSKSSLKKKFVFLMIITVVVIAFIALLGFIDTYIIDFFCFLY